MAEEIRQALQWVGVSVRPRQPAATAGWWVSSREWRSGGVPGLSVGPWRARVDCVCRADRGENGLWGGRTRRFMAGEQACRARVSWLTGKQFAMEAVFDWSSDSRG